MSQTWVGRITRTYLVNGQPREFSSRCPHHHRTPARALECWRVQAGDCIVAATRANFDTLVSITVEAAAS